MNMTAFVQKGVKCYALCPTFADTNLVRSSFNCENQWTIKSEFSTARCIEDISKATLHRLLTVEDVGEAMMKSLKFDKVQ